MKRIFLISLSLVAAGCAASHPHATACSQPPVLLAAVYDPHPSAALVFTPPITLGTPVLDLSRNGRAPEAFWGYTQGTTDYYDVVTDDYQNVNPRVGAYRESVSERFGTSSR